MQNLIEQYRHTINSAAQGQRALRITGSSSKAFYGRATQGEILDATAYRGIVAYEPTELVLTARAGTPLLEIEAALAEKRQMLAFEPPHFGAAATLGGCIASGLSGPRRAYAGALRDYVLGVRMMDGKGAVLNFGGQVMKNVAGYDVSRLMAGSLGTLGLLLEVSLKVLPVPASEATLRFEMSEAEALAAMNRWAAQPLSLSASCYYDGVLTVRLSGAAAAVRAVQAKIGGDVVEDAAEFWRSVREQQHEFFSSDKNVWRLSLPSTAPSMEGKQLIEWGGALRWLVSDEPAETLREKVAALGGQATLFRSVAAHDAPFHPLSPALLQVHQRLKKSFDPHGVFNAGRMYPEF
jgi:glycolate oxidase FAD binding subunit